MCAACGGEVEPPKRCPKCGSYTAEFVEAKELVTANDAAAEMRGGRCQTRAGRVNGRAIPGPAAKNWHFTTRGRPDP